MEGTRPRRAFYVPKDLFEWAKRDPIERSELARENAD